MLSFRRATPLILAALAGATMLAPGGHTAPPPSDPDEYRPVRGPSAPAEYRYLQKTLPGEGLPRGAYADAAAQARRLPTAGAPWRLVGPTNIGGRITSLALDPTRPDTVYAAAASGSTSTSAATARRT